MGKRYSTIICLFIMILMICVMPKVPRIAHVRAEENVEENTEENAEENEDGDLQEPEDQVAPEVTIICLDEDRKEKEEIWCELTVSEEDIENCEVILYIERRTLQGENVNSTINNLNLENGISTRVGFHEEGFYQIYLQATDKAGNKTISEKVEFLIDRTIPDITIDMGSMQEGGSYSTLKEKRGLCLEILDASLIVDTCKITISKDGEHARDLPCDWEIISMGGRVKIVLDESFEDGGYQIQIYAQDEVGNQSVKRVSFIIDNTVPQVVMNCDADYTQWTDQDLVFQTKVEDKVSGLQEVVYKIKGEVVKKVTFQEGVYSYDQQIVVSEEADKVTGYAVVIEVKNRAGLKKTMKRQVYIDKTKPEIVLAGVNNGEHYSSNQSIITQVKDLSFEGTHTTYYVTRILDGKRKRIKWDTFSSKEYQDDCVREVTQEGQYEIYAVTVDAVGHQTRSNTLSFVIDKTAPVVKVTGADQEKMSAEPIVLKFSCVESFYESNKVEVKIQRTLDGKTMVEKIKDFPRNQKKSIMEKVFDKDGTYQVTISSIDQAGNIAANQSVTFSVDRTKPELQIMGTDNYKLWDKPTTLRFRVVESYYEGNQITIVGTRQDLTGNVVNLNLPEMECDSRISSVMHYFQEDGIYTLQMFAKDLAGNENMQSIHFVIDQTNPEINGVEQYDGGYYPSFRLTKSTEDIFRDLTVVSYQMRLNGVEYNGTDEITQEGKYDLQIEVQDELGHRNTSNIEFVIDHTAPKVQFYGVVDGEKVQEPGKVSFRLEDEEDSVMAICMNGRDYDTSVRELTYEEYGSYRIEVDCKDRAGNRSTSEINFQYVDVEEEHPVSTVAIKASILVLVSIVWLGFCIRKIKRRDKKNDESSCV